MGFFSELKDDLSQAVNELMPEEAAEQTPDEDTIDELGNASLDYMGTEESAELLDEVVNNEAEEMETSHVEEIEEEFSIEEAISASTEMQDLVDELNDSVEEEDTTMDLERMLEEALAIDHVKEDNSDTEELDVAQNRNAIEETAIITGFMVITGNIESEGSVELLGTIRGNVDILGKLNVSGCIQGDSSAAEIYSDSGKIEGKVVSEGAVKIGTGSVVIGDISAASAVIAGAVKGDIDVKGPVILDSTAIVMGNIKSKSVQINNGAVIEGMCSQAYAEVSPTSFFEDYKPESKKSKK